MNAQFKYPHISPFTMRIDLPFTIAPQIFHQTEKCPSLASHRGVTSTSHLNESINREPLCVLLQNPCVGAGDRLVPSSSSTCIGKHVPFKAVVIRILSHLLSSG